MPAKRTFGSRHIATTFNRSAAAKRRHTTFAALLRLLVLMAVSLVASRAAAQLRTVAVTGDTAPDRNDTFASFTEPIMNAWGEVAFNADLYDELFNETNGIWSTGYTGELRTVVTTDYTDPETNRTFSEAGNPLLTDLGDVAFFATTDDYEVEGIWTDRDRLAGDEVKPVVLLGDNANNTNDPTRTLRFFQLGGFDNVADRVAITASMPPATTETFPSLGVFSEDISLLGVNKIAEVADPAPGSSGQFLHFPSAPTMNDSGRVAFVASLTNGATGEGVWTDSNGTLSLVARYTDIAPDTDGKEFSTLFRDSAVINNNGDVAFTATLTGLIGGFLREGIWVRRSGTIEKVMLEGEAAPGTGGANFNEITSSPLLDGAGYATFVAQTDDVASRDGLWSEGAGGLELVALEGEPAPGTSLNFLNILDFAVNDSGFVAFKAQLSDLSVAIFAQDPSGQLRRIVGDGDTMEIYVEDQFVEVEVEFVDFAGLNGQYGSPGNNTADGWNDTHQLSFHASFYSEANLTEHDFIDGGEGVFVTDAATVPLGDMNLDGVVDEEDVPLFIQALVNRDAYDANGFISPGYYAVSIPADVVGDVNQDGVFDFGDIAAFSALFDEMATSSAVPEPSSGLLLLMAAACCAIKKRSAQGDRRCAGAG